MKKHIETQIKCTFVLYIVQLQTIANLGNN